METLHVHKPVGSSTHVLEIQRFSLNATWSPTLKPGGGVNLLLDCSP